MECNHAVLRNVYIRKQETSGTWMKCTTQETKRRINSSTVGRRNEDHCRSHKDNKQQQKQSIKPKAGS